MTGLPASEPLGEEVAGVAPRYGTDESRAAARDQVLLTVDGDAGVAWLTLNRPAKHNAMSVPMRDRIAGLMREIEHDANVEVVVIRGAGRSFCSGNEINEEWGQRRPHERRRTLTVGYRYGADMAWGRLGFSQAISRSSKITIAQVHGFCAAAAYFMIATKCDLVAVAEDARIGALEARFLGPAGAAASVHINRIIGTKATRSAGYTALPMVGAEVHRLGLACRCVPADELGRTVDELARDVARRARGARLPLKARSRAAESNFGISVPSITGLLVSHFLQPAPDELNFWDAAREGGVSGALSRDRGHSGIDPRPSGTENRT